MMLPLPGVLTFGGFLLAAIVLVVAVLLVAVLLLLIFWTLRKIAPLLLSVRPGVTPRRMPALLLHVILVSGTLRCTPLPVLTLFSISILI